MALAWLFLVISLHSTTEALQCNRYRERTIMNVAMNNKCYYAWPRMRGTYNEAVKLCQKGGTHVLFTETKEEHHRLLSRLGPAFTRIWIGLERNGSEWRWQGGQGSRPVQKLLFADNHDATEGHNAIVSKSKGKYIWQVQNPNNKFQIVCEQDRDKNTAGRVFKDSLSDTQYETTGTLGISEAADNAISTATDTSSLYVVGQGTPHVLGSLTEPVVMVTGESSELEGIKSSIIVSETQMPSGIFDHRFEIKKYSSSLTVPSGVNVETVAILNEEFTVLTDAIIGRALSAESRLEQSDVHGHSIELGISRNLGAEPISSLTPGQFSIARRSVNWEQTMKMEQTFTLEQSSKVGDYSFIGQDVNPAQMIKPEQTFNSKQSSRRGCSSLKETNIISEQTIDQGRPIYIGHFTSEAHSSNPQHASVRQPHKTVTQDTLEEESTPVPDHATLSSSEILSVGFSATAIPTSASTALLIISYQGTESLPSVDGLISSPIRSQILSSSEVTASVVTDEPPAASRLKELSTSHVIESSASGIIESSADDMIESSAFHSTRPSASVTRSSSGLNESPFSSLSTLSASDMPLSATLVSDVIGSDAYDSSTFPKTGSAASSPLSSRLVFRATVEGPANGTRIQSIFSSLSLAPAVIEKSKSDSTNPSTVSIPFSSSHSSLKPASLPLDTPASSTQEPLAIGTPDPVQVGLAPFQKDNATLTFSSPEHMGHVQDNVSEILEAGYYVAASSSDYL
ncbi:uncharacterized protein [Haliotis asinina]|uniref:uncharacterized protein n=1 Tax=Haliotis asinina TaxID=109174 RepID=UPI003531D3A6